MASSSVSRSAATRNLTASTAPAMAAVAAISCAVLLLHLWFNNRYGYFRDEFDYISCGNHLAWGYVDQPPLIPFPARSPRRIHMLWNSSFRCSFAAARNSAHWPSFGQP